MVKMILVSVGKVLCVCVVVVSSYDGELVVGVVVGVVGVY